MSYNKKEIREYFVPLKSHSSVSGLSVNGSLIHFGQNPYSENC